MLSAPGRLRTATVGAPETAVLASSRSGAILFIAAIAVVLQSLDLATGIRLMLVFGTDQEQNPIARTIFQLGGPIALAIAKYGVVLTGVAALLLLARAGRPRLARYSLMAVALIGLIGFASNLV